MIEIQVKHGVVLCDDEDAPLVSAHRWYSLATSRGKRYAYAKIKGKRTYLHHVLLGNPRTALKDGVIDHVNGDGLDNRRSNLRAVTHSQNLANSGPRPGSSRFKGVSWDHDRNKWFAKITVQRKQIALGRFDSEHEAAVAYDRAAVTYFGDCARLNIGPRTPDHSAFTGYLAFGAGYRF